MQQVEFALSVISTECLSKMIAKLLCHTAVFSTFLRESGPHNVNMGWPSHKLFLILFSPL
jgi:hypothetical protein